MILKPIFSEKSLKDAKLGKYSFWVSRSLDKAQIKSLVKRAFGVEVRGVATVNFGALTKRNAKGRMQKVAASKKAIVSLKSGKIALFDEEKKGKKKK